MCGIAGLIHLDGTIVNRNLLQNMSDAVIHRGPDGSGLFTSNGVGLAHRRLAIIDLSDDAAQPMTRDDRYVLTYNGEIYNYIEIRKELSGKGHRFSSTSDSEVVLAAYAEWGPACVEHFNGMWSFIIYDQLEDNVFVSRDRFGIKPLYYISTAKFIAFASEIKQLVPLLNSVAVNSSILADFLVLNLAQHSEDTFFQDIKKLPQGHSMLIDRQRAIQVVPYFQLTVDTNVDAYTDDTAFQQFNELLQDSIKLRLRSDVTVGSCLSGGLDSSTICALASGLTSNLKGITASSGDPRNDETHWAGMVAKQCGMDWHCIPAQGDNFLEDMSTLANVQEEPFSTPSIYLQFRVFREAAIQGCRVMLDGQGGDETLMGYERHNVANILSLRGTRRLTEIGNVVRHTKLSLLDIIRYTAYFLSPALRRSVLSKRARTYLSPAAIAQTNWQWIDRLAASYRNPRNMQELEISAAQLPNLLMYEDKNSMAHSVESRLPFLDYRLVQYSLSLANQQKIRQGWSKWILRRVAETALPADIAWRRDKVGFEAPSQMFDANYDHIMQTIRHSDIWRRWRKPDVQPDQLSAREAWKLFFVANWEKAYGVSH